MKWRYVLCTGVGVAGLSLTGLAAWMASLPDTPDLSAAPAVNPDEMAATLAALKPPKRSRPLVAVVGLNNETETTDYLITAGILRRADIADVVMLATDPGPVTLFPALRIQPDSTIAAFETQHPAGADYVIVPAMSRDDDPQVLAFLKRQAASGAIVVSVCAGAKVIAAAGLLDGARATTHWYYVRKLFQKHPDARYVPDRRLVVDRRIATTTGITASMPMMLTLIEAIAGRERAEAVAAELGKEHWGAEHSSREFVMTRQFASTVLANKLAFWNRETFGISLQPGVDEVSLAFVADAWSRTYRSRALTISDTSDPIETRNGIRILPDRLSHDSGYAQRLPAFRELRPSDALKRALAAIANRYGAETAEVVAMQLEYPRRERPAVP